MEDFSSPSEKTPLIVNYYRSQTQQNLGNTCAPYRSPLCSEIEAKIGVFCVNCGSLGQRDWQGRIIGKGLHGSLNALCARIKATFKGVPLMRLWTACFECCAKLGLDCEDDQMDMIFSYRYIKRGDQEMVVRLSYKEVEEMVSSKVIMTEGRLLNANTIKTAGKDGQWKKWQLWNPPKANVRQ
jgi:hypothetical protein